MLRSGLITVILMASALCFAAEPYVVTESRILHEIDRSYSFEEASSPLADSLYVARDSMRPYVDTTWHLNFWLKLTIRNNTSGYDLALQTTSLWLDRIEMYQPDPAGRFYSQDAGMFAEKEISGLSSGPHLIMRIPYTSKEQTYYFHYIRCEARPWECYVIDKYNDIIKRNIIYHAVSWFILAAFIIVLLQALTFYINTREKLYLYYAFHVFFVTVYALLDFNLLVRLIGHRLNYLLYLNLYTISFVGSIFALMFYTRTFFNTRKSFPLYDKILIILVLARFLTYIVSNLPHRIGFYKFMNLTWWDLPLVAFALFIGIRAMMERKKYAVIFSLSFTILILSILLPHFITNSFQINIPYLSMIYLETLLFFFAITYRFRIINREKEMALVSTIDLKDKLIHQLEEYDKLKDKVTRELELKVQERTEEIRSQAEQIENMNDLLKKHNIELKSDIESLEKARVLQEYMSFEEFRKTYPDDISCYAFLEKLKWGTGYECRKCGNTRFSHHDEMLRRKCSRCGSIESPTADTFFHNIKFPLHKAFYLLYLFSAGKTLSLEELSKTISLRTATIWSFKKKTDARIKEAKAFKKSREGWISLIKNE